LRLSVGNQGAHGIVEKMGLLGDDANGVAQRLQAHMADVAVVNQDSAAGRIVKPRQQTCQRRLAGSGAADQGNSHPALDFKVDLVENLAPGATVARGVAEADVLEAHRARPHLERPAQDVVGYLGPQVKEPEDALDGGHRGGHDNRERGETLKRQVKVGQEADESDQRTQRSAASHYHDAGDQDHHRRSQLGQELRPGLLPGGLANLFDRQVVHAASLTVKAGAFFPFAGKGLDRAGADDPFLQVSGEHLYRFLKPMGCRLHLGRVVTNHQRVKGHHPKRHNCQPAVEHEQQADHNAQRRRVDPEVGERRKDELLGQIDIDNDLGENRARRSLVEKAVMKPLQMSEDRLAQVVDKPAAGAQPPVVAVVGGHRLNNVDHEQGKREHFQPVLG
jgi:hypothetical protein